MGKLIIDSSTLTSIGDSIREKLGTTEKINPSNMGNQIRSIKGNTLKEHINHTESAVRLFYYYDGETIPDYFTYDLTENATTVQGIFESCSNLIEAPSFDTHNVTSMSYMFNGCRSLKSVPVLDTNKTVGMQYMFYNCRSLESITELNTSNVMYLDCMFNGCTSLKSIPQLDTTKTERLNYAFQDCYLLETIDLTTLDKITNMYYIAKNCYSLKKFIIRNYTKSYAPSAAGMFVNCYHFTGTVNETYNPDGLKDGAIYIPDDCIDMFKANSSWSDYADIIKPLSELVE